MIFQSELDREARPRHGKGCGDNPALAVLGFGSNIDAEWSRGGLQRFNHLISDLRFRGVVTSGFGRHNQRIDEHPDRVA